MITKSLVLSEQTGFTAKPHGKGKIIYFISSNVQCFTEVDKNKSFVKIFSNVFFLNCFSSIKTGRKYLKISHNVKYNVCFNTWKKAEIS